ncbi:beta-1,3-galactosyltransferase 5-like [Venturia canescens]|uniref:beta-1,3-galactosyltransferase 5-like n=1 Tax=Venturia canescens TaxID=32260 RepID=UPI001C9D51D4|nr:beta-1,3-galactosyltransferase 5-like [Venturia canescens]
MTSNDFEMNKIPKLRNRTFLTLILGLVGFTFFAYYRTSVNEVRPLVAERLSDRTAAPDVPNEALRVTAEGTTALVHSSVNSSSESSGQSTNIQHAPNVSTSLARSQSELSPQTSLSSANPQSSGNNETTGSQRVVKVAQVVSSTSATNVTTTSTTKAMPTDRDTARGMYQMGHDVTASDQCPNNGKHMELVITIASAPSHIEARTAVRQTWGHFGQRRDIAIVFMLGKSRDAKLEKSLKFEENLYGDIVRGRYYDSYTNLTLKTISSLEWVSSHCGEARFMLKTDDDMFINVPRLLSFIHKHAKEKNVIFGRLAKKWKPFRNKKSKYYVPLMQYKPAVFPDFTTGPAYLMSRDVVEKLYVTALDQTYLKLEDVFTTGIVAEKLSIRRSHANEFLNTRISHTACNVQRGISIHMVKYKEQFDLWKKLLDGTSKCK